MNSKHEDGVEREGRNVCEGSVHRERVLKVNAVPTRDKKIVKEW